MKKFKKVIQGIWFSLKLTFGMKEGAQYVVYKLFLTLLDNLVPLALTIFPGLIINELLADRRITYLIVYVLVLALVPLIKEIVQTFSNRRVMSLEQSLSRRLMSEFYLYILRMDYETLKHFSIVSTSDQIRDRLYPYIAGNVLSAVLPEQAAVWSYPVSGTEIVPPEKSRTIEISSEKTALNMVNSMLGRTHLSSDLSFLNEECFSLVKEGVEYIKKLNAIKKIATPYFPLGFTDFSEKTVACGLKNGDSIYLAVWVLGGNETAVIPIKGGEKAEVAYPVGLPTKYSLKDEVLTVEFKETDSARFFEIKLKTR